MSNGRKKLLIIGKTGTGKSTLCNAIAGKKDLFETSSGGKSCTNRTKFANISFNNNHEQPISIIDTIGFDDSNSNEDNDIVSELVEKLKNKCDHVNLFGIAVNGQSPRLEKSLIGMLCVFEGMFGKKFWNQVVLIFTRMPMDKKNIKKRERMTGKPDHIVVEEFLRDLADTNCLDEQTKNIKSVFLDAAYDEDDEDEKEAFQQGMTTLYTLLKSMDPLDTDEVRKIKDRTFELERALKVKQKEHKEEKLNWCFHNLLTTGVFENLIPYPEELANIYMFNHSSVHLTPHIHGDKSSLAVKVVPPQIDAGKSCCVNVKGNLLAKMIAVPNASLNPGDPGGLVKRYPWGTLSWKIGELNKMLVVLYQRDETFDNSIRFFGLTLCDLTDNSKWHDDGTFDPGSKGFNSRAIKLPREGKSEGKKLRDGTYVTLEDDNFYVCASVRRRNENTLFTQMSVHFYPTDFNCWDSSLKDVATKITEASHDEYDLRGDHGFNND